MSQYQNGTSKFKNIGDTDQLKSVYSILCKPTSNLILKHHVNFGEKPNNYNNQKGVNGVFARESGDRNGSVTFKTNGALIIETVRPQSDVADSQVYIREKDMPFLLILLETGENWLRGELSRKIFITDSIGNVQGVSSKYKACPPIVQLMKGNYLSIVPGIIKDDHNSISYQGIIMKTARGDFIHLTGHEFMTLSIMLKSYLTTIYNSNMTLACMGMMAWLNRN